jgi:deoxyribonuclease-1
VARRVVRAYAHAVFSLSRLAGALVFVAASCSAPGEGRTPSGAAHDRQEAPPAVDPPPATPSSSGGGGNHRVRSFVEAKRALGRIYEKHRVDLYCGCSFAPDPGNGLRVDLASCGYVVAKEPSRAGRIEWEHAIAASWFGRTFSEWTVGSDRCVDRSGKRFKGRRCAETSPEFARMEGDMHNLFPVVGEVNALRADLPMGILDSPERAAGRPPALDTFTFGACRSTVERGVFLPRAEVRGDLARASLYMDRAYPARRLLDDAHRALFERWSAEDPLDEWERERGRLIAERQGNENPFIR